MIENLVLGLFIAINIALKPNPLTIESAMKINSQLATKEKESFSFDSTHYPHVTILQMYVQVKDLNKIYEIIDKVSENYHLENFTLTKGTFELHPIDTRPGLNFANINFTYTPELKYYQADLMRELAPYKVSTLVPDAFYNFQEEIIDQSTINYVENFDHSNTGDYYQPHLTLGLTREDAFQEIKNSPNPIQSFTPVAAIIYHIGNFGTARKELHRVSIQ